jgi:hypothetical protein
VFFYRGKFAQKPMPKTGIVGERDVLLQLLSSPNISVLSIQPDFGSKILLSYKDLKSCSHNTNVVIAAITTSHARILLYQMLHLAGRNVLAVDTDSCIFFAKRGQEILKTGPYLGDLTDETLNFGNNAEIVEFASAGPKNYCLRVKLEDGTFVESRKIKGITLKANNQHETSMETLKRLINGEADQVTVNLINKIQRSSGFEVFSSDSTKKIQMVYDKRARIPNTYDTIPWGTVEGAQEVAPDPNIIIPEWEICNYAP